MAVIITILGALNDAVIIVGIVILVAAAAIVVLRRLDVSTSAVAGRSAWAAIVINFVAPTPAVVVPGARGLALDLGLCLALAWLLLGLRLLLLISPVIVAAAPIVLRIGSRVATTLLLLAAISAVSAAVSVAATPVVGQADPWHGEHRD